jgi:hypothetical protein
MELVSFAVAVQRLIFVGHQQLVVAAVDIEIDNLLSFSMDRRNNLR